jgi:hypothetical protein
MCDISIRHASAAGSGLLGFFIPSSKLAALSSTRGVTTQSLR